jgi:hypothetical protein
MVKKLNERSSSEPTAEEMTVTLPPNAHISCQANNIVVNELLCFLNHQLSTIPTDLLTKLCADFYTTESIVEAKRLLFDTVDTGSRRLIKRTGTNKARDDLLDIIRIMLELQPGTVPVFVASNLSNLPPLGQNNADMLSVLRDIAAMKQHISQLTTSQKDIVELVKKTTSTSEHSKHEPTEHNVQINDVDSATDAYERNYPPLENRFSPLQSTADKLYPRTNTRARRPQEEQRPQQQKMSYTRSSKENIIIGSGPATSLRAATHNSKSDQQSNPNRSCSGIFLSRLHPRTTIKQIETHLHTITGNKLYVMKIETRFDTYASFFIRADRHVRNTLLDPCVWPNGSLVKLYFD